MTFSVVERPGSGRSSSIPDEFIKALKETVENKKAIEAKVDGSYINWQSTVRNRLKKFDLRLRAKYDKASKTVTCWAEELNGSDDSKLD